MGNRGKVAPNPDVLGVADLIYRAAVDAQAWPAAMTGIADAVRARAMSLTVTDPERRAAPLVVAPRTDPEWLRIYLDRWAGSNLVRQQGSAFPVGQVYQFEDFAMPRSEFERTPFYTDFWAPQRMNVALLMNAISEGEAVGVVGFYRSWKEGRFERDEERLLSALGPHLRRALALNLRLGRIEMQRDGIAEMLNRCAQGALLVDAQARVLFANAAAEAILREGAGLRVKDGRLVAGAPTKTAALRHMIAGGNNEAAGDTLVLPCHEGANLAVLVLQLRVETTWLPRRPAAILFVKDPRASDLPSREQIRLLFDLTPAQAALAREILRGDGVQAAATRLGISRATARTHLLEVFQKTGTSRQAELVRVILQQSLAGTRDIL